MPARSGEGRRPDTRPTNHFLQVAPVPQFNVNGQAWHADTPHAQTQRHRQTDRHTHKAKPVPHTPGFRGVSQVVKEGVVLIQEAADATDTINLVDTATPPAPHTRVNGGEGEV